MFYFSQVKFSIFYCFLHFDHFGMIESYLPYFNFVFVPFIKEFQLWPCYLLIFLQWKGETGFWISDISLFLPIFRYRPFFLPISLYYRSSGNQYFSSFFRYFDIFGFFTDVPIIYTLIFYPLPFFHKMKLPCLFGSLFLDFFGFLLSISVLIPNLKLTWWLWILWGWLLNVVPSHCF